MGNCVVRTFTMGKPGLYRPEEANQRTPAIIRFIMEANLVVQLRTYFGFEIRHIEGIIIDSITKVAQPDPATGGPGSQNCSLSLDHLVSLLTEPCLHTIEPVKYFRLAIDHSPCVDSTLSMPHERHGRETNYQWDLFSPWNRWQGSCRGNTIFPGRVINLVQLGRSSCTVGCAVETSGSVRLSVQGPGGTYQLRGIERPGASLLQMAEGFGGLACRMDPLALHLEQARPCIPL